MARPREFDEEAALNAATECFWTRGYEATSTRDLAEKMGITGASLYNAFGDKRSLFLRALDRYVERGFEDRAARLEGGLPPRAAIQTFFDDVIERSVSDPERKGCLLVNSALDVGPHDLEFHRLIRKTLMQIEAFFCRCVEAGQLTGTISTAHSAKDLGRMLLAVLLGIRVLARSRPQREVLEGLLRPVASLLDAKQQTAR
jgi:TetR/AcrR family transcriptional repressor of nem operon